MMDKCYACGREIENTAELCPYCRFPKISTIHGNQEEKERIRQFAEEYKRNNPQYFSETQPEHPQFDMSAENPQHDLSAENPEALAWKQKYEELKKETEAKARRKSGGTVGWILGFLVLAVVGFFAVKELILPELKKAGILPGSTKVSEDQQAQADSIDHEASQDAAEAADDNDASDIADEELQMETEERDYEAEALLEAENAWAEQTLTDPQRFLIDSLFSPSAIDTSYETSLMVMGGSTYTSTLPMVTQFITVFVHADPCLNRELLNQALSSADSDAQARIREEMLWGNPVQLHFVSDDDPGDAITMNMSYDVHGNLIRSEVVDMLTVLYSYDENNNLTNKKMMNGDTVLFELQNAYDEEDRIVQKEMKANEIQANFHWDYDSTGRITAYDCDIAGDAASYTLNWNEEGELSSIVTSHQGNSMTSVPEWEDDARTFFMSIKMENGEVTFSGTYDESHRVTSYKLNTPGNTISTDLTYGEKGGISRQSTKTLVSEVEIINENYYNSYGGMVQWNVNTGKLDAGEMVTFVYHRNAYGKCESVTGSYGGETAIVEYSY